MKYVIEYSLCCNKGKMRRKNQDNFWCEGFYLNYENNGFEGIRTGTVYSSASPVLAVFDGMGGEQLGEYAAYIAAATLNEKCSSEVSEGTDFLLDACREINGNICDFARKNGVGNMGSTGCFINFAKKDIFLCNIGDSKIYRLTDGTLTQLSVDHCLEYVAGKAPLTQFLGVPESEFIIQPYYTSLQYKKADRFLICSDGLTDMVELSQIQKVLSSGVSSEECCSVLLRQALDAGGRDNITILICDVKKKSLF